MENSIKNNFVLLPIILGFLILGGMFTLFGSIVDILSVYYSEEPNIIMILFSTYSIGRIFSILLSSKSIKMFTAKKTFLAGCFFILVFLIASIFNTSFIMAFIYSSIAGFGHGLTDTSGISLLYEFFPNTYASKLSLTQSFFGFGNFLSPFIISAIVKSNINFKLIFVIYALISITAYLSLFFIKGTNKNKSEGVSENKTSNSSKNMSPKITLFATNISIMVLSSIINCILLNYTTLFAPILFNIDNSNAINLLTFFSAGGIIGSLFFSVVLKRVTPKEVAFYNSILALVLLTLCLILSNFIILIVLFLALGGLYCIMFTLGIGISGELYPENTSWATSIVIFSSAVSYMIIPIIIKSFESFLSFKQIFYIAIGLNVLLIFTTFIYLKLFKKYQACTGN